MWQTVELPLWLFVLIVLFAAVTFASHFLFPSVRWFFRRRLERAVARLNERLSVPIEPFKLARRHDMIQRILYDPEVTEAIVEHARNEHVREDVAFEKARRYAREIVPSFSAFAYFGFGIRVARWLATQLYEVRTGVDNMERIKSIPEGSTVIFVMNHRSNMDYVLVTYLAARASALSYAVGEWARVWPLSRLIKSMGAYFIRRKSRGALYRKVLAKYVELATMGGVTQAIFPEGGLSLDGNLARPKLGLLAYVVDAYQKCGRDVAFVPVAIAYDRVLEDRVLVAAHTAGNRRFRARMSVVAGFILRKLWLRITGRFLRFGGAGVVFGAPTYLSSFGERPDPEELAEHLMQRISTEMPLMGVTYVARTLLDAEGAISQAGLKQGLEAAIEASPRLIERPDMDRVIQHMEQRGLIIAQKQGWAANPAENDLLQFYANAASHAASAKS
ncbi:MAG: 1-acyl-sn-glycerol-3-phosphate acyltransferase [Pseudomonadota bacterium]